MTTPNLWDQVCQAFDKAASYTSYSKGILEQIKACNNVYRVCFPFKRDNGMRLMVSAIVEIALKQRWNIWALFEGAPFQAERAGYVDFFAGPLLEDDIGTYFRFGTTYKF